MKQPHRPLLHVKDLSLCIQNRPLLKGINFTIYKGETFALVGESGSGKSLTALALMRLLPHTITFSQGDIFLEEVSLLALPEYQMQQIRGKRIAMIFQEPMSALNPVISVGKQVEEVLHQHLSLSHQEAKKRVMTLFEEVGIPEASVRYDWYPHQLSGGQKQRVMIAMALACEPELLIADEPTTALDVTIQAQIITLLETIRVRHNISILFISHDLAVVSQIAERIGVMREGELLEITPTQHFFQHPQHPYSQQLLASITSSQTHKRSIKEPTTLLEVEALRVYFTPRKRLFSPKTPVTKAVDGVSFCIHKGETVALVGESGSGKSTIGEAILSLVPISSGKIRFKGRAIEQLLKENRQGYRRAIQVVFQDPFASLNPRMRIGESIAEGMESVGIPHDRNILEALMKRVELDPAFLDRYPHAFSGGQRQRIAIARALALSPELIVCDEPTSALDVTTRTHILALLQKIQQETQVAYLFITHDLSIVPTMADKIVVLEKGRIIEQGETQKVMEHPNAHYTQRLLSAVPHIR